MLNAQLDPNLIVTKNLKNFRYLGPYSTIEIPYYVGGTQSAPCKIRSLNSRMLSISCYFCV